MKKIKITELQAPVYKELSDSEAVNIVGGGVVIGSITAQKSPDIHQKNQNTLNKLIIY
ncbi:hypothetical protein [Nostoc sp. ChiSLP03a]|uniref:hypothetical protein n=1 Tax=Nostoc sp. ChiSLP03a TaxID=3075380 RepID=UPI002AD3C732|nr:hypothetical protein [Nostoc sp. ChiSLP03a]MDZ8209902.1 hypothetical protein [Nostoc sp. ChiSLP03a]